MIHLFLKKCLFFVRVPLRVWSPWLLFPLAAVNQTLRLKATTKRSETAKDEKDLKNEIIGLTTEMNFL